MQLGYNSQEMGTNSNRLTSKNSKIQASQPHGLWASAYALKACHALALQPEDLLFSLTADAQNTSYSSNTFFLKLFLK